MIIKSVSNFKVVYGMYGLAIIKLSFIIWHWLCFNILYSRLCSHYFFYHKLFSQTGLYIFCYRQVHSKKETNHMLYLVWKLANDTRLEFGLRTKLEFQNLWNLVVSPYNLHQIPQRWMLPLLLSYKRSSSLKLEKI